MLLYMYTDFLQWKSRNFPYYDIHVIESCEKYGAKFTIEVSAWLNMRKKSRKLAHFVSKLAISLPIFGGVTDFIRINLKVQPRQKTCWSFVEYYIFACSCSKSDAQQQLAQIESQQRAGPRKGISNM